MTRRSLALLAVAALACAAPALATLPSTASRVEYSASGGKTFTFNFATFATSHVEVFVNGAKQASGFTVSLNANQASSPGGSVTFTTAPLVGAAVRIQRTVPLTQDTVFTPYSAFPAKTTEKALDRIVQQQQQLERAQTDLATGSWSPSAGQCPAGRFVVGLNVGGPPTCSDSNAAEIPEPGTIGTTITVSDGIHVNGRIFASAFGLQCDNVNNLASAKRNADALQAAVTYAQATGGRTVVLPTCAAGYNMFMSHEVVMAVNANIGIEGAHNTWTGAPIFKAYSSFTGTSLFRWNETDRVRDFRFKNFRIDGAGVLPYGFYVTDSSYMVWDTITITNVTEAGLSVQGFNNEYRNVNVKDSVLDGIRFTGQFNNGSNVIGGDFEGSGRFGILFHGGQNFSIKGTTIQGNDAAGLYVKGTGYGLNIQAYFEANASVGYTFTTPARTVKADIILNGIRWDAADLAVAGKVYSSPAVNVEGSSFFPSDHASDRYTIYAAGGARHLRFTGNAGNSTHRPPILGIECSDPTKTELLTATIADNEFFATFPIKLVGTCALGAFDLSRVNWDLYPVGGTRANLITVDPGRYAALGIQNVGQGAVWKASGTNLDGFDAVTIGSAVETDVFGTTIDTGTFGSYVGTPAGYLYAYYRCTSAAANIQVYVDGYGVDVASGTAGNATGLTERALAFPITSGTKIGFAKTGGTADDSCTIVKPIISRVGDPRWAYYTDRWEPLRIGRTTVWDPGTVAAQDCTEQNWAATAAEPMRIGATCSLGTDAPLPDGITATCGVHSVGGTAKLHIRVCNVKSAGVPVGSQTFRTRWTNAPSP